MADKPASGGKRIALVLGSGGARGLAHIGVIQSLEALGYEITYISGASMGAQVGGVYAAGSLDDYTDWISKLERKDVISLLDFSFGWQGLLKGERVIGILREMVGERNIEDLDIGFTAVATDLDAQREIWFNKGPLFDAIRASIAIPSVLTPWEHDGRVLVDGGLLNPVPIAPALNQHTDMIVAVNLNSRRTSQNGEDGKSGRDLPGVLDVMTRSFETMQGAIARLKLAAYSPNVVINIPRDACNFYEFYRAKELIELGRERADEVLANVD